MDAGGRFSAGRRVAGLTTVDDTISDARRSGAWDAPTACAVAIGLLATIVLGLLSDGVHQDDDLAHFLMARWARWFPEYLFHLWARPGLTVPLASVAWIGDTQAGWACARILSALVTAVAAWIAASLARSIGVRRPWIVAALCYLQPYNALLAATTLTENFAALYLIAGLWFMHRGRAVWASAVFSLVFLTRHESIIFLPVWWLALGLRREPTTRRVAAALLALWAPVVHNLVFRARIGWWPAAVFSNPSGSTEYPAVGPFAYLPAAFAAIPPAIAGLAIIGGILELRRGRGLPAVMAAAYLVCHVSVKALGVFASGGYPRFMVLIAPAVAVLAGVGWQRLKDASSVPKESARGAETHSAAAPWPWLILAATWAVGIAAVLVESGAGRLFVDARLARVAAALAALPMVLCAATWYALRAGSSAMPALVRFRRWRAAALAVMGVTLLAQAAAIIRPLRLPDSARAVADATDWLRSRGLDNRPIFATNPWVCYFLDLAENPRVHKGPTLLAAMPVGTICLWDEVYGDSDFHVIPLEVLRDSRYYAPLMEFLAPGDAEFVVHVFEKVAPTPPPPEPDRYYPPDPMTSDQPIVDYYIRINRR